MLLILNRNKTIDKTTIGELTDGTGHHICYTLEDEVRDLKTQPKVYGETAIPEGIYKIVITYSPHFKTRLPLLLNVEGFEGVRIHSGNTIADTEGCILVGTERGKNSIKNSRIAFNALFTLLERDELNGLVNVIVINNPKDVV